MNDFIKRFIDIVKGTGKWAALLAVIITILAFAAEEFTRWDAIHNQKPDVKNKKTPLIEVKVPDVADEASDVAADQPETED
jgi:hypothetical protein